MRVQVRPNHVPVRQVLPQPRPLYLHKFVRPQIRAHKPRNRPHVARQLKLLVPKRTNLQREFHHAVRRLMVQKPPLAGTPKRQKKNERVVVARLRQPQRLPLVRHRAIVPLLPYARRVRKHVSPLP